MKQKRSRKKQAQGEFDLGIAAGVFGDLAIDGARTLLRLSSRQRLPEMLEVSALRGRTFDGRRVTCLDCITQSHQRGGSEPDNAHYALDVFPHYVALGDRHLDPDDPCITRIEFTTRDLSSLFYDFDAFSFVIDTSHLIDPVLFERRALREVEAGPWPQIAYFTGKLSVYEVETSIGKISVNHRPQSNMGGPAGVFIENTMRISITPENPMVLADAQARMHSLARFLSVIAGRAQGARDVEVHTSGGAEDFPRPLAVHASFNNQGDASTNAFRSHPGDVPIDPLSGKPEFDAVIRHWMASDPKRRIPRERYLNGLRLGNRYTVDRLVAAANMFDVMPADAYPAAPTLDSALLTAQTEILELLRGLGPSQDRDNAISAISRMGKLSLPKKVAARTQLILEQAGDALPSLQDVVKTAIQCRNHFVHGSGGSFKFEAVEPLMPFLTDALEFVYAASELIDAGWDASRLGRGATGDGHSFGRFMWGYPERISDFRVAMRS